MHRVPFWGMSAEYPKLENFRYFIHSRCYEPQFLFPAQFFQVNFAFRCGTSVMAGFYVNQLFGLAAAKIFRSPPDCMLVEASGDIDTYTCVERD